MYKLTLCSDQDEVLDIFLITVNDNESDIFININKPLPVAVLLDDIREEIRKYTERNYA